MRFRCAHASHPDWTVAVEECLLLLARQTGADGYVRTPNLGFLYLTDPLVRHAGEILSTLKARTGVSSWVGASGAGICATGTEYMDEPALAVMLGQFAPGTFNVFSGHQRAPALSVRTDSGAQAAWTALVHADPETPDLPELLPDMAHKVASGYLFGGVASGRHRPVQIADQVLRGGLSGVVFAEDVALLSRISQGCFPMRGSRTRTVTAVRENQVLTLDGQPAFEALLQDAGLADAARANLAAAAGGTATTSLRGIDGNTRNALLVLARQGLFVGLEPNGQDANDGAYRERLRADYAVRHVVALDPGAGSIAIGGQAEVGQRLSFCVRNEDAARKDLVRICSELRDAAQESGAQIAGAVYFSCLGRGGHMFGEQGEELRLIAAQLGPVPLVGLYANGEIGGQKLYGYTGVLSVLTAGAAPPSR
jgi:small ligand-binding sensory domain FIST